jgi:hypothetical protein
MINDAFVPPDVLDVLALFDLMEAARASHLETARRAEADWTGREYFIAPGF